VLSAHVGAWCPFSGGEFDRDGRLAKTFSCLVKSVCVAVAGTDDIARSVCTDVE
jgi:hypothetical protein